MQALIEESIRNKMTFWIQGMLNIMNVPLFKTKTVKELIAGFEDPLLNMGKYADPNKGQGNHQLFWVNAPSGKFLQEVHC